MALAAEGAKKGGAVAGRWAQARRCGRPWRPPIAPSQTAKMSIVSPSLWCPRPWCPRPCIPEEILTPERFKEGATHKVSLNAYERSPAARQACIDHYGYDCAVCERSMADLYGKVAEGVIHVHHLKDLATIGEEYQVDPIDDLRPVCPNCHAVLHTDIPAMSISDLRKILAQRKRK